MTPNSSFTCFWEYLLDTPPQTALWAFSNGMHLFKKENIPKEKWIHIINLGIQKKMMLVLRSALENTPVFLSLRFPLVHCALSAPAALQKSHLKFMNGFSGWSREQSLGSTHSTAQWCCHSLLHGSPSCLSQQEEIPSHPTWTHHTRVQSLWCARMAFHRGHWNLSSLSTRVS